MKNTQGRIGPLEIAARVVACTLAVMVIIVGSRPLMQEALEESRVDSARISIATMTDIPEVVRGAAIWWVTEAHPEWICEGTHVFPVGSEYYEISYEEPCVLTIGRLVSVPTGMHVPTSSHNSGSSRH